MAACHQHLESKSGNCVLPSALESRSVSNTTATAASTINLSPLKLMSRDRLYICVLPPALESRNGPFVNHPQVDPLRSSDVSVTDKPAMDFDFFIWL